MKEKARLYQLQRHDYPELITVKPKELEERVSYDLSDLKSFLVLNFLIQAKEHEIQNVSPFLQSKLFTTNGYTLTENGIEKRFSNRAD